MRRLEPAILMMVLMKDPLILIMIIMKNLSVEDPEFVLFQPTIKGCLVSSCDLIFHRVAQGRKVWLDINSVLPVHHLSVSIFR